jgi:hypothetical protein
VLNQKPPIEKALTDDFKRRSIKPQTPSMIRKILKETSNITPGGIHLPPNLYVTEIDRNRIEKVVLKIAQGLFYSKYNEFLPLERVKDFRFCLNEKEVPEFYKISWKATKPEGVYKPVFSYKHFYHSSYKFQLYSVLFWDAVMFCVAVENL